ncbi:MAG TPA: zf-HC2 domain-containing protein [Nevskiaceae bacterium]|nr:zf-HC2 domain-containing protein [Nevskiaceae bacterium]
MSETLDHRRAWELIPWLVNGRASDEERALVDSHVRECADCRSELAFQREVQQGMLQAPEPTIDARAGLDQLWKRIDAGETAAPRTGNVVRWLVAAVVVEAIGLATLSTGMLVSAPYQTLSSPAPSATRASLRAVFAPQMPQSQLQSLLQRNGLQIVAGPSEAGAYALALTANASTESALAALRADPHVIFAEPVQ